MIKKIIPVILIIPFILSSCSLDILDYLDPNSQRRYEYEYKTPTVSEDTAENTITGYGFYYNQLSSYEKDVYENMFESAVNYESETYFSNININSFYKAAYAISYDQPQFFWINGNYSIMTTQNNSVSSVSFNIPDDAHEINSEIESLADEVLSEMSEDLDDYGKLKYIYEWIINNVDYETGEQDQDIRSVFLDRKSVCAGYSRAFEYFCDRLKIPCTFISGKVKSGESHAWNLVYLTGNYYWVDVTWGDPLYPSGYKSSKPSYDYFMVSDNDMFITHDLENDLYEDFTYPRCYNDNYNYYAMNGSYFYEYDQSTIDSYILSRLDSEEEPVSIDMKFASKEAWDEAYADIVPPDGGTSHAGELIKNYYNTNSLFSLFTYTVSYSYSETSLSYRIEIQKD